MGKRAQPTAGGVTDKFLRIFFDVESLARAPPIAETRRPGRQHLNVYMVVGPASTEMKPDGRRSTSPSSSERNTKTFNRKTFSAGRRLSAYGRAPSAASRSEER